MVLVWLSCNRRIERYLVVCLRIGNTFSKGRGKVVAGMKGRSAALRGDGLQAQVLEPNITRLVRSRHVDAVGGPQVKCGRVCKSHFIIPQSGRVETVEGNPALSQLCRDLNDIPEHFFSQLLQLSELCVTIVLQSDQWRPPRRHPNDDLASGFLAFGGGNLRKGSERNLKTNGASPAVRVSVDTSEGNRVFTKRSADSVSIL